MLKCFSHVKLFANIWTVACQAPLSMRFSRQEDWHANKHIDQKSMTKKSEINPHPYIVCYLMTKKAKNVPWGKDSLFNKWYWEN